VVAGIRFIGLMVDGPGTFTSMTLKAEVAMAALSACAAFLERWRSRGWRRTNGRRALSSPVRSVETAGAQRLSSFPTSEYRKHETTWSFTIPTACM
jgi:hypothetical protein